MATFLSPGVYTREQDQSLVSTVAGPTRPVFIGTAQKGPINVPTFVTSPQQAIDTFGNPFSESYLMYAVLAFMEEGNQAWIVRVAVEQQDGQDPAIDDFAIDTSGGRGMGWGRIPIFSGIDYGRLTLRAISTSSPITFHDASVDNITYTDREVSTTDGATDATLHFSGSGTHLSSDYTGAIDDSFIVLITSDPDEGKSLRGATYEVIRNSDNTVVASGHFYEVSSNTSEAIDIGDGLVFNVHVTSGVIGENDNFRFSVHPDNRIFSLWVEGSSVVEYTISPATYTVLQDFVDDVNALVVSEDYEMIIVTDSDGVERPQFITKDAGRVLQIMSTSGFCLEVSLSLYSIDVPRSHFIGADPGPYQITSQNNRLSVDVIPPSGSGSTAHLQIAMPAGLNWEAAELVDVINSADSLGGTQYITAYEVPLPAGTNHILVVTALGRMYDQIKALATWSNNRTLRLAEELGVPFPYGEAYRGFTDGRQLLPTPGETDSSVPLSCEQDSNSDTCTVDTAYFENIVGWLVAPSAGTWINGYTVSVDLQPQGVGDLAGRYRLTVRDLSNNVFDIVEDISFDPSNTRYIANVINPGTTLGGTRGNEWVNWEERPIYLNNDPLDVSSYEIRQPSQFTPAEFVGAANGIPNDPAFSSEIDAAVIGNPARSTGIFTIQNPESYDVNVLVTPGFNSGAIIGQCLQMVEARGDMIYLVDPPFGLRPQQVVDWHNGMLTSDMASAIDSSYGALYWSWIKIFDQFNQQDIWIPPSGHVAAVFSRTGREADQWFAPAGLKRGRLKTALDLEFSPSQGERDLLYGSGNSVNALVNFPKEGITIWGQRTLLRSTSALSRVGVRMLMIYLKKNLSTLMRNFLFEPNDTQTWAMVKAVVEPLLSDVQARQGIDAFRVVVDESNNTPERRDRGELWVSVFVKPTRTVEFVVLNLVILRTSATFQSEEVLAAAGVITA